MNNKIIKNEAVYWQGGWHDMPVRQRIRFKLAVSVFKGLADDCVLVSSLTTSEVSGADLGGD